MLEETLQAKELLTELLYAVIIVALPIISTKLTGYIHLLKEKADAETVSIDNADFRKAVDAATNQLECIIIDAVTATNQTYVDELKKQGAFGKEQHTIAYKKTYDTVKKLLTEETIELLVEAYGDIETYINTFIEKTVRNKY